MAAPTPLYPARWTPWNPQTRGAVRVQMEEALQQLAGGANILERDGDAPHVSSPLHAQPGHAGVVQLRPWSKHVSTKDKDNRGVTRQTIDGFTPELCVDMMLKAEAVTRANFVAFATQRAPPESAHTCRIWGWGGWAS